MTHSTNSAGEPGRNDPCPCGSGLKYKKCCLLRQSQQQVYDFAYESHLRVRKSVTDALHALAAKDDPDWEEHILDSLFEGADPSMLEYFSRDPDGKRFLLSILQLSYIYAGTIGDIPVWEYISGRYAKKFTGDEASFIESLKRSRPGFYRVEETYPAEGRVQVQNILTKKSIQIIDKGLASSLVQFDIFSGIAVPYREDLFVMEGCPPMAYQPDDRETIIEQLRGVSGIKTEARLSLFLNENPVALYWVALDYYYAIANRPLPKITTTDGEEFVFSKSYFSVKDHSELIAALDALKDHFDEEHDDGSVQYAWLNAKDTLLGHILIEKDTLVFETNSKERLKKWKTRAKKLPLEFVRTEYIDMEDEREKKGSPRISGPKADLPENTKQEIEEFSRQYVKKHYDAWIDMPLPALDGKTPKQAVQTAAGKKKVSVLIDSMENKAQRSIKQTQGSPQQYFDADEVRRKLGIR